MQIHSQPLTSIFSSFSLLRRYFVGVRCCSVGIVVFLHLFCLMIIFLVGYQAVKSFNLKKYCTIQEEYISLRQNLKQTNIYSYESKNLCRNIRQIFCRFNRGQVVRSCRLFK